MELVLDELQIKEILAKHISAEINRQISPKMIEIYEQQSNIYGYGPELKAKVDLK